MIVQGLWIIAKIGALHAPVAAQRPMPETTPEEDMELDRRWDASHFMDCCGVKVGGQSANV